MKLSKQINLMLHGHGMLYPVHAGAVNYLHDNGYEVKSIAGSSSSSIVAAAVASGISPGQPLIDLVMETLPGPNGLIDRVRFPMNRISDFMLYGDMISQRLTRCFPGTSFRDTQIPLAIIGCCLSTCKSVVWSSNDTPSMTLDRAILASMSIPLVFKPVEIGGVLYCDGSFSPDFPVDMFGIGEGSLCVLASSGSNQRDVLIRDELHMAFVDMLLSSKSNAHIPSDFFSRVVELDTGFDALHMGMSKDEARSLISLGYEMMKSKLSP